MKQNLTAQRLNLLDFCDLYEAFEPDFLVGAYLSLLVSLALFPLKAVSFPEVFLETELKPAS